MTADLPDKRPRRGATGPRSLAGRRRSAQNARKHGLTAAHPDAPARAALTAAWRADPLGVQGEADLLLRLADARIRAERVRRHQAELLAAVATPAGDAAEAQDVDREALAARLALTLRYRAEAEAAERKALRALIAAAGAPEEESFDG